jgi:hypothetical protein
LELENTRDPDQRLWLLSRIRESEQEYLHLMEQERERVERENANMEAALAKIREIQSKK